MNLLFDEMISPQLPMQFHELGFHAEHVRNRGMLSATDAEVWELAQAEKFAVCTANGRDFRKLAVLGAHSGLVVVPGGGNRKQQFTWIVNALLQAIKSNEGNGLENRFIEVHWDATIAASEVSNLSRFN